MGDFGGSDVIVIICLLLVTAGILFLVRSLPKRGTQHSLKQLLEQAAAQKSTDQEPAYDRVRVCASDDEVLGERLRMIDHAEKEIRISVAEIRINEGVKKILSALYYAAKRGIHIYLLLNRSTYAENRSTHNYLKALGTEKNVQIKTCEGLHDHYLLVDGDILCLSGRDIDSVTFENHVREVGENWEMLVVNNTKSPVSTVEKVHRYFDLVWNQRRCKKCCSGVDVPSQKRVEQIRRELIRTYPELQRKHMEWFYTENYDANTVPTNRILITRGKEPEGNLTLLVDSPDLTVFM